MFKPSPSAFSRERLGFQRRAERYARLDRELHGKTRFFGAACLTNRVLAAICATSSSGSCPHWLWNLGAVLETKNLALAGDLSTNVLCGVALDRRLIAIEQSIVQNSLLTAQAEGRPTGYANLLRQLNGLLNHVSWMGSIHPNPHVRWYSALLVTLRDELGAPLDFAQQLHREAIGAKLTSALRGDERLKSFIA